MVVRLQIAKVFNVSINNKIRRKNMKFNFLRIFLIIAMLGISLSSYAYYGDSYKEHMVNTWWWYSWDYGNDQNKTDQKQPDVAVVRGTGTYAGYFVIVWQSYNQWSDQNDPNGTPSKWDIYATRFMPDKTPIDSPEMCVHLVTPSTQGYDQQAPSIAADSFGNIIVAWQRASHIMFRKWSFVDAPNIITGAQVEAANETSAQRPVVGFDDNNRFVLAWHSDISNTGNDDVRYQLFDYATTTSITAAATANSVSAPAGNPPFPKVDMNASGDFVLTWQNFVGGSWGIYAKKFYWTAGPTLNWSAEFKANNFDPNDQTRPAVAIGPTGNFVLVWQSWNQPTGSKWDIWARRYDNSVPVPNPLDNPSEKLINAITQSDQTLPDVDMDDNDYYMIAWQSKSTLDNDPLWGIRGAELKNDGTFQQTEFQVNNITAQNQTFPTVAVLRLKLSMPLKLFYVVAWQGDQLCTTNDIYFKLYDLQNKNAITLEDFSAIAQRDKVVLNWKTGTEIDNLGYYIVRSVDPESNFELVNKRIIPSNSNSTVSGSNYTYNDSSVNPGTIYYYWLVSVDTNGGYNVYGPVDVITYITAK
jgi:hypothetical protein